MGCCDSEEEHKREESNVRGCTDIFWLCLYIAFLCLMLVIAAFSFVYGNPLRLVNGYDSFGNTCGVKHNMKVGNLELSGIDTSNKPFLLTYDPYKVTTSLKVCVEKCPTEDLRSYAEIQQYYGRTGTNLCKYDFNFNNASIRFIATDALTGTYGPCPVIPVYKSAPVLNRCVPTYFANIDQTILTNFYELLNSWDTLEQVLGDLYKSWPIILGLAFLALVISLATVSILHLLAHLVSYILMILFSVASIGGTAFLWYTYFEIKGNLDQTRNILLESARNETAFFWYSIIASVITVIILLIVIFMRKQVDFLANLFKETSKCLMHLPALFLQPVFTFIVLTLFFMFWLFVVVCLSTAYYPGVNNIQDSSFTPTPNTQAGIMPQEKSGVQISFKNNIPTVEYIDPIWVKYMWWVYFIGLIWTSEFIMGCQQMVIAGSVAHWFYRHKYQEHSHVWYAIGKLIKYHLGSIALGSLLITMLKVPRLILQYLHEKLRWRRDQGSECAKCGLKCCICCFYCLEKFLKYLNHNAYTVIAIDGVNFCSAAKTAFEVLTSHALQVATINSLGDFILFLGKCFVTALTGIVGLFLFRRDPELKFYAVPTLIVCVFAFFIAHCILSLYEMVLDTIYLCMCQNEEVPDGIRIENLGMTKNGEAAQPTQENELEAVK